MLNAINNNNVITNKLLNLFIIYLFIEQITTIFRIQKMNLTVVQQHSVGTS